MKTADQAIHDNLWKILSFLVDGKVYEDRPMTEVGYPFADFEDFQTSYTGTKHGNISRVSVSLNVWETENERKHVSEICGDLMYRALSMQESYGYKVSLRVNDSDIRIVQDRTVAPPLWRGIVNLIFDIL